MSSILTAVNFGLFVASFAAPGCTAYLGAYSAGSKEQAHVRMAVGVFITLTVTLSFHYWTLMQHPGWSLSGFIMLPYVAALFSNTVACAVSVDYADERTYMR